MLNLWPLLLPVAALSGWLVGRQPEKQDKHPRLPNLSRQYYAGLNYLLNEQPDQAVDVFIKLVEIDTETVETHLALGSLFRKRGEVDRAIRIHQNLIARPQLTSDQRVAALVALGQDYMSAGVLDRAERIFTEVVSLGGDQSEAGLKYLLEIYQMEKSWYDAIKVAERLKNDKHHHLDSTIAHFYCELAEIPLQKNDWPEAQRHLRKALYLDQHSVRGNILLGRFFLQRQAYQQALTYFKKGIEHHPEFLSEIMDEVKQAYIFLGKESDYYEYLLQVIQRSPDPKLITAYAAYLASRFGVKEAKDYLLLQLRTHYSVTGIAELINYLADTEIKQEDLNEIHDILTMRLSQQAEYRCQNCGFSRKTLHWQCPGCRKWGYARPVIH